MSTKEEVIEGIHEVIDVNHVTIFNLIGLMGTGKTNWIHFISSQLDDWDKFYIQFTKLDTVLVKLKWLKRYTKHLQAYDKMLLAIDDLSFGLKALEEKTNVFLNIIARIRHIFTHYRKFILIFVYHYSKSILPFLRLSHIRIVTSITTKQEINSLKEYFDLADLWNFYELKQFDIRTYFYYSLINIMGRHYIVKPPLSHDPLLEVFRLPKKKKEPKKEIVVKVYRKYLNVKETEKKIYVYDRSTGKYEKLLEIIKNW